MREARRIQAVQTPVIPVVGDLIRRHPGTLSLGQGVVGYGPPPQALQAIDRFLGDPEGNKYGPVAGLPALREALKAKLESENGIRARGDGRVVVTAGGNMAFVNALLAIADPGDEVILLAPYYFNHEMAIIMAGCRPVPVPTDADYQPSLPAIRAAVTGRTRAVVTISPNNPTGAVYPEATLRALNDFCRDQGLYHISDEAYEYFTYDGARHFSPGSIPGSDEHTISLFSFSKAYGFASWRIGYMVLPAHLVGAVRKIQDTILICPPVISQYAALGALEAGSAYCRSQLEDLARVRAVVREELAEVGSCCTVPQAQGAFYFFLRVHTSLRSMDLVERLVREHGVGAIPGDTFGMRDGCYLRVAYGALGLETAAEGVRRLTRGLRAVLEA